MPSFIHCMTLFPILSIYSESTLDCIRRSSKQIKFADINFSFFFFHFLYVTLSLFFPFWLCVTIRKWMNPGTKKKEYQASVTSRDFFQYSAYCDLLGSNSKEWRQVNFSFSQTCNALLLRFRCYTHRQKQIFCQNKKKKQNKPTKQWMCSNRFSMRYIIYSSKKMYINLHVTFLLLSFRLALTISFSHFSISQLHELSMEEKKEL